MTTGDAEHYRQVFWIGGSVCAGKSTTAETLGERFGTQVYHFDRQEPFHIARSIPEDQPHLIRFMSMTMDERWVLRLPKEMAREVFASWTERFAMVLEDLRRMLGEGPVIAEGVALFPELVASLLVDQRYATWLIFTPEFREWMRRTRGRTIADHPRISDRDRAFRNLLERDLLIASYVEKQATEGGLTTISVDNATVGTLADRLEPQVRAWIRAIS